MEPGTCPFCNPLERDIIVQNSICYERYDRYPVNPGHTLIIPFRHVPNVFNATSEEVNAIWNLIQVGKKIIDATYSPDGYNLGVNVGEVSGQSIQHFHVHMIPRYTEDVEDARGGVRNVIPMKRSYQRE